MRGLGKIVFPWLYERMALPGPGSENIAYKTQILNLQTAIGPATANNAQLRTRVPTSYVPLARGLQGIGGPQAGYAYATPLTVRNNR